VILSREARGETVNKGKRGKNVSKAAYVKGGKRLWQQLSCVL